MPPSLSLLGFVDCFTAQLNPLFDITKGEVVRG